MNMTYVQVNRWFANRRRKVIKRTKVAPSPASVTPATEPLVIPAESDGRIGISVPAEHLEAFLHAISAQQQQASSPSSTSTSSPSSQSAVVKHEQQEMVMQQNSSSETPLTPPADDQAAYSSSQIVPEMIPYQAVEQALNLQKLLQQLQPQLGAGYNPAAALALLGISPIQYYQAQLAAAQQLAIQHQLQAHMLAVHQEQQQQQQLQHQNLWMQGGSISASPAHISDSEISEMSELSPPPLSSHVLRPHSPFKDPHGIADTDMLALMSLSKLSEREQQAVNILLELSTDVR